MVSCCMEPQFLTWAALVQGVFTLLLVGISKRLKLCKRCWLTGCWHVDPSSVKILLLYLPAACMQ